MAQDAIEAGHVRLNGERPETARTVKVGDRLELRLNQLEYHLEVRAVGKTRPGAGGARVVLESEDSMARREARQLELKAEYASFPHGESRPTKKPVGSSPAFVRGLARLTKPAWAWCAAVLFSVTRSARWAALNVVSCAYLVFTRVSDAPSTASRAVKAAVCRVLLLLFFFLSATSPYWGCIWFAGADALGDCRAGIHAITGARDRAGFLGWLADRHWPAASAGAPDHLAGGAQFCRLVSG